MYKFISWNVNGLRAVAGKGFADIFEELDADFFCLQETKLQAGQIDLEFMGYQSYWNYADKKGYSGTAVYTRHTPKNVTYGIGIDEHDHEGRVITLEMEDFYLVNVYVPNAQDGLRRLDYRMKWEDDFRAYLKGLAEKKHARNGSMAESDSTTSPDTADNCTFTKGVVVCGDLNVAHKEIDLKNPKGNRQNPGFTDEERGQFTNLLKAGFTDTFRYFYPDQTDIYSWWSYRFQARQKNVGWRIDYFVVSDDLRPRLKDAKIHTEIFGSDHCPVELTMDCRSSRQ